MSVCCQCIKTTADSSQNYDNTIFINIDELYIEYDIFDSDKSIVESNTYEETEGESLIKELNLIKIK